MRSGTFKLAYDDDEAFDDIKRGPKIVNKTMLPSFSLNEFEKKNFANPNMNALFTQKIRANPSGYDESEKMELILVD